MSGHKKQEDEAKQVPIRDPKRPWHEDYLDPMNVDTVDEQLIKPQDHKLPADEA